MPKFTDEQIRAITTSGTNIIVSAGAGSGKTAVLTERVIEKLRKGISLDRLLVLTFTHAAADEMKYRIRKKIKSIDSLSNELKKLDSSYITTFDSFSLSLVKKYHYLLNITNHVEVCDSAFIELRKKEFLDAIFEERYSNKDSKFLNLISTFCVKDDIMLQKQILAMYNKIQMKYDKVSYLSNYVENSFNNEKIENDIKEFENYLKEQVYSLKEGLNVLSCYVDGDYIEEVTNSLKSLFNAANYDEIVSSLPDKIKNLPKGSDEQAKSYKKELSSILKTIKDLCIYKDRNEIKEIILSTKSYVEVISSLLLELDQKLSSYKQERNLFEFIDIAHLAIKIVDCYPEIREEIKNQFNEILVDEYQDTNDLQELFISLISNNNVYMVGDIKQSIYRFRNANPTIFKEKYEKYSKEDNGIKIDLNKNFRSRREVLNNINYIFDKVMDSYLGGAQYQDSHRMVFGNTLYEEKGSTSFSNDFEIYNYAYDKNSIYTKEEIEVFTIAKDIKEKIDSKYQVFDKETNSLRDAQYKDFVILLDRSTDFELYKKIFEYMHIPLTIHKDQEVSSSIDMLVFSNLFRLLKKVNSNEFDKEFTYSFVSILRSFLYAYSDEEIFDIVKSETYKEVPLYKSIEKVIAKVPFNSPRSVINILLEEFDYYNKLLTIGDISDTLARIDYIKNITQSITSAGYTIYDLADIIDSMLEQELKLTTPSVDNDSNSCRIMTIHKSKGLEFPICYYAGLTKSFNIRELNDKFLYDLKYGIVTPYFKEGIGTTIYKILLKGSYLKDEISEKIRLFYVSLTRCREKMIFVSSFKEEEDTLYKKKNIVQDRKRLKYRSFQDIFNSIEKELLPYTKEIDIDSLELTKDYNLSKKENYEKYIEHVDDKIEIVNNNIEFKEENDAHFSKTTGKLLDEDTIRNMEYGTKMHYYFELLDFKTKDLSYIEDEKTRNQVGEFLKLDILNNVENASAYKEYEFLYEENNTMYHGIIDLMLEYSNYIDIIDYKLSNIDDSHYEEQLSGYKNYIENKTGKKVNIYLYSINRNELRRLS